MVVVTVTEYHGIDSSKVNAQNFGVLHNCVGLPRIEQELVLFGLDINAQPMLCDTAFTTAGIFYKCDDLHQCSPQEWLPQE